MRIITTLLILSGMISILPAQTSFVIENIHRSGNEYISDMQFANSRYYAVSVNTESQTPFTKTTTLSIFNDNGQFIRQMQVGGFDCQYFRILSINHNKVRLLGNLKSEICTSILSLSEYDITSGTLTHLAQYNLCEGNYIHSVRIVPGLDGKTFLEAVYSTDEADQSDFIHKTLFFELDTNHITLIPGIEEDSGHLSVDFSGKGYVVRWAFICEYYDRNFNHRYQHNDGGGYISELNSATQPLVNHYLLEHLLFRDDDYIKSEQIRLIDSNLHTKKMAIIEAQSHDHGIRVPPYGGLALGSYNCIWATANFGNQSDPVSTYFSLVRLDSDLKIVCNQFFGFDAVYQIIGITAFEENGAIVYGYKRPFGSSEETGDKDIFALKIGNECELSTTATNAPTGSIVSISAYPNPGLNDLTFSVNGFDPSTLSLEFVDETGKILFTKKDLTNSIQIPPLSAGQYFYRILKEKELLGVGSWMKE